MGGRVEVVLAEPAVRRFPAHLSEALGVCVKFGGAHDVVADGRRRRYPAESVSVRAPGCVWASEEGWYGFASIDVAPALLPPDWAGAGMRFAGPRELPGVAQAARRLIAAREPLEADEALVGLLAAVFATRTLASDVARDDTGGVTAAWRRSGHVVAGRRAGTRRRRSPACAGRGTARRCDRGAGAS
jgi:hypothetical protein